MSSIKITPSKFSYYCMWEDEIAKLLHRLVVDKLVSVISKSPEDEWDMSDSAFEWSSAMVSYCVKHLLLEYVVPDS